MAVLISFIVSFSSLFLFLSTYGDTLEVRENAFYSQHFSPDVNKIFILGSSHVGELNVTRINEQILADHDDNYHVYDLAISADDPQMRLSTINEIILAKPKIVVYGLEFRMFEKHDQADQEFGSAQGDPLIQKVIIPITHLIHYDWNYFSNPQLVTMTAIQNILRVREDCTDWCYEQDLPFYSHTIKARMVILPEFTQHCVNCKRTDLLISPEENQRLVALEEIIKKLQENKIKVVLLITPHSRYFLDSHSDSEIQIFNSMLDDVSKKFNVKLYTLEENYANLNIWSDVSHVAYNKTVTVYTEDVSKIILNETLS